MPNEPQHFHRDRGAGAALAESFGAGVGNAEALIDANALRFTAELGEAQMFQRDDEAAKDIDVADVASELGLNPSDVKDYTVRGQYVVVVAESPDGRLFKEALRLGDDGSVEAIASDDDPRRAALRASLAAADDVSKARREAERIIAEAERKAKEIAADAAGKAAEQRDDALRQAGENLAGKEEQAYPSPSSTDPSGRPPGEEGDGDDDGGSKQTPAEPTGQAKKGSSRGRRSRSADPK